MRLSRCSFPEKKNTAHAVQAKDFVGVKQRQNESGVLRGGTFFLGNHPLKVVVITVSTTTFSAGFGIKGIMEVQVRQYGFSKFIMIKQWK